MATHSVKVDREPIGSVKIPCDEKVWRNMELQAKEDGWSDMMWASDLEVGTLYGRRAVLVKTEPTRPAWLGDGAGSAYVHIDLLRPEGTKPLPAGLRGRRRLGYRDGPPRIRSELGGLMGPGYQATGYEPPPRRQVLLDDPTGDDIAGDA